MTNPNDNDDNGSKKKFMTDEQLISAGFGFLINQQPLCAPAKPFINKVFTATWSANFYHSTDATSGERYFGNENKSVTGLVVYRGDQLAIVVCEKTKKEVCVNINEAKWEENTNV